LLGITFPGEREVELIEFPDPVPGPGEVVLEIKASGMCGSDLHSYRRPRGTPPTARYQFHQGPIISGHEPCGIVVAIDPAVPAALARLGARVMVHHYAGCGGCTSCRSGWQQLCYDAPLHVYGANDHGAHAKYLKVPATTLVPLPDELSFAAGAAISCGTGTAYGGLRRLDLSGRDTIAIYGQGPVGLAATQLAKAMGARVIALDISASRLEMARTLGADETINPADQDPVDAIKQLTRGEGVDASLDSSGSGTARQAAVRSLKTWGKACLIGEGGELRLDVSPDLLRKQATVMGSWTFSTILQAECARFVVDRKVDADAIFSNQWRLEEASEAYRLFDSQTTGKGVFLL
jgi:threonine dehydrogenase-like Zn-dependent dehydrogenase